MPKKRWTKSEEDELFGGYEGGMSIGDISEGLKRSKASINSKVQRMNRWLK